MNPSRPNLGGLPSGMPDSFFGDPRAIAVLPLINISPDPENEYICDGLAEELINGLTQVPGLRVVSRSSSFRCKGSTADIGEIGKLLKARLIVHGSVRRVGDQFRLMAQLSDAQEGYQIWSQSFEAQVRDLFALQDELTAAVLEKLRFQLGARFSVPQVRRQAEPAAYSFYLQGRYAFHQETADSLREALSLFVRATDADPAYASAWTGVAEAHLRLEWYGLEPASQAIAHARSALQEALRLEPESVTALYLLGAIESAFDWNWLVAGRTFEHALAARSGLVAVHFHYALDYLTPLGRLEEALDELRYASQLDPLSPITNTAVGGCYYRMRRWQDAARSLRETLRAFSGFGHAHWSLGRVLLEQESYEEALQHFEEGAKIIGRTSGALAELGYGYARMGRAPEAREALREMLEAPSLAVGHINPALVYAGLGDTDRAMHHLEEAFRHRTRQLAWVNVDPRFDPLRPLPAFQRLVSELRLSEANERTAAASAGAPLAATERLVTLSMRPGKRDTGEGTWQLGFSLTRGTRIGHYLIESQIGAGGMGAVYRAIDVNLQRPVALKVISGAIVSEGDKVRFAREAQAASTLNHPNIVTIYEYSSDAGIDFMIMEYVDGRPLDQLLARRNRGEALALKSLLRCLRGVASALFGAHQAGIVHRDVKPGNIMLCGSGEGKVLDFGLAKRRDVPSQLTQVGAVVGTPGYMSPEQAMGEAVDWRTDIFSFGIILHEILYGVHPFQEGSDPGKPVQPPTAVPALVAELAVRCLRKDREQRLQSLAEAVLVLDQHLAVDSES
ncbi:MAG: protein kinase [Candidatus Solibacter sp.]